MLNDARVQSYFLVGIWDHLNDHCRKAYRSRSGDNPKTRRAEATQAGHCIDQLYRWIGVRHAVLNYAHIMHLLAGGVHGACSTALETTSKKLTTFAAALDKAEKDLAAYDFKKLLQGGDTQKFHEADAAFLAAEKAMLSACNVHLNLTLS